MSDTQPAWVRQRSEKGIELIRLRGLATGRAKQRLVEAHREEYERYRQEERRKLGLS